MKIQQGKVKKILILDESKSVLLPLFMKAHSQTRIFLVQGATWNIDYRSFAVVIMTEILEWSEVKSQPWSEKRGLNCRNNKRHCFRKKHSQRNLITLARGGVKASLSALWSLLVCLRLCKGFGNSEFTCTHYIRSLLDRSIRKSHFGVQIHNWGVHVKGNSVQHWSQHYTTSKAKSIFKYSLYY